MGRWSRVLVLGLGLVLLLDYIGGASGLLKREQQDISKLIASEEFRLSDSYFVNRNSSYFNYSGYNSWDPIKLELYRLAAVHDFVTVERFGESHERRPLLALHINKNNSHNIIMITSLIHAREWIAGCISMNIIHRLVTYNTAEVSMLLSKFHFIIIPVMNPDGYHYSHTKNRLWRKNREPTQDPNCFGVDVNRNFIYGYNREFRKNSEPCQESYAGTEPLSTKEATATNSLIFKLRKKIKYFIDYHAFGNLWMNSYGAHEWKPNNEIQLKRYRERAVKSLNESIGVEYKAGSVISVIYECHGIVVDHVHYYITPLSMTVEVGNEHDEFDPSDYKINTYTIAHWKAIADQLALLKEDLENGQYLRDRRESWRRVAMKKRV